MTSRNRSSSPAGRPTSSQTEDMSGSESDADDHPSEAFSAILACMNHEQIAIYCSAIRRKLDLKDSTGDLDLPIIEEPMFGSYHALFPVRFHDDLKWIIKFPATGTRGCFDSSASNALVTEAKTMKFLRRTTSIPIPDVIDYDASIDNEIGCPFILMEFLSGVSLYDCWFDPSGNHRYEARTQALKDIASAMAQLDRFSFKHSGALLFDLDGTPKGIGPMRCVDLKATLDRIFAENGVEETVYFDCGPFKTAKSFYEAFLKRQTEPSDSFQRGIIKLLHLFSQWIPQYDEYETDFVLAHPDFDIQNFIVSQDGHLLAIIDWDGLAAVPRSLGYESYPGWLTRDWDPAMYGWTETTRPGAQPDMLQEDSPTVLAQHRSEYEQFLKSALFQERQNQVPTMPNRVDRSLRISCTTNSLYAGNLFIATTKHASTFEILKKFIDEINEVHSDKGFAQLDTFDVAAALGNDTLEQETITQMREGFQLLLEIGTV